MTPKPANLTTARPAIPKNANVMDPAIVTDLFNRAAQANLDCSLRKGYTIHLPPQGHLVMTGDLHDHLPNFQKILHLAKLKQLPDRHLILHELIHGPNLVNNYDTSVRILARAATIKIQYPDQLHFLQSNHELAQLLGAGISKNGVSLTEAFDQGLTYLYKEHAPIVKTALNKFLTSLPLAARTQTGLFFAHSLPSPHQTEGFDYTIIDRAPSYEDIQPHGPVHQLVWGRRHDQPTADAFAKAWNTKIFVLGHQPAEMGYYAETNNILVLASNHNHGVALPLDLAKTYTFQDLTNQVMPLNAVMLD